MNLKLLTLILISIDLNNSQHCNKDGECDGGDDITNYDKGNILIFHLLIHNKKQFLFLVSNEIHKKISDAMKNYLPCKSEKCSCHIDVLKSDLKPYENGITREMLDEVKRFGILYQIIDNKIYRQTDCNFPSRCSGVEYFIKQVMKSTKLSNMEIVINVRDYPQIHHQYGPQGPVLSFSKTNQYKDIMYPAWSFREGGPAIKLFPTGLGRFDLLRELLSKAAEEFPWNKKLSKAFFRGSRTSDERDPIVLLSRSDPNLVDAQYTKNQAWKSPADTLNAEPAEEVSFEDHCKFKYLFNYRGVAASFRFKHLFLCKSLVFHVGDEWKEFFYDSLKPWVHYIPVDSRSKEDDLKQMLKFFENNQDLAQEIAQRGHEMIMENLRLKDVECYWRKLLTFYGKLVKFNVEKNPQLIEIK